MEKGCHSATTLQKNYLILFGQFCKINSGKSWENLTKQSPSSVKISSSFCERTSALACSATVNIDPLFLLPSWFSAKWIKVVPSKMRRFLSRFGVRIYWTKAMGHSLSHLGCIPLKDAKQYPTKLSQISPPMFRLKKKMRIPYNNKIAKRSFVHKKDI